MGLLQAKLVSIKLKFQSGYLPRCDGDCYNMVMMFSTISLKQMVNPALDIITLIENAPN